MDRFEAKFRSLQHVTVTEQPCRPERGVLVRAGGRRAPEEFGTGPAREQVSAGRVIRMRMGHEHPAYRSRRTVDDRVDVVGQGRSGVNDSDLAAAEKIGIRSRPRHHRRVGRHDAGHPLGQLGEYR